MKVRQLKESKRREIFFTREEWNEMSDVAKDHVVSSIVSKIKKDCKPFLKESENQILWRGEQTNEFAFKGFPRPYRRAKDTRSIWTNAINDYLAKHNFDVNRSNSIFASGEKLSASHYGNLYAIFPIGNFSYLWNPKIMDVWYHLNDIPQTYGERIFQEYLLQDFLIYPESIAETAKENARLAAEMDMRHLRKDDKDEYKKRFKYHYRLTLNRLLQSIIDHDEADEKGIRVDEDKFAEALHLDRYRSSDLEAAIRNDNEIMIKCDAYYAIHPLIFFDYIKNTYAPWAENTEFTQGDDDLLKQLQTERKSFKDMVLESSAEKLTHLEHIEDLMLDEGFDGAKKALDLLNGVRKMLNKGGGKTPQVTTKWDGAPSLVAGIDPEDGEFFVGTKSVFAKNPKIIKSKKDLKMYDDQPGLQEKLALALKYLPKLGIKNVVQGDFLFTKDSLYYEQIDGEEYVTFTPNTITYAVNVKSEGAKKIMQAEMGIVFHSFYTGNSLKDMQVHFNYSADDLKSSRAVWYDDATFKDYTGIATITDKENAKILKDLHEAYANLKTAEKNDFNVFLENENFSQYIKPFINARIRDGQHVGDDIYDFLNEFKVYFAAKMQKEIDELKYPMGAPAERRRDKMKDVEEFINNHIGVLAHIFQVYMDIIDIKNILVKHLSAISNISTFIKTEKGYKITGPEGFVAVGHDGSVVKLNDRLEFNKANATLKKNWL